MAPVPDISEMTDAELREQLKAHGADVGPIVSTTRLFYEKKLGKLIMSGGKPQPEPEESEEDYDDEEEDEEVQFNYKSPSPPQSTPPRQQRQPADISQKGSRGDASPSRYQALDTSPKRRNPSPSRQQRIQPEEVSQLRQRPQTAYTPVTQARRAEPTLASSVRTPQSAAPKRPADSAAKTKPSSGGGLGMWIKLLLIVVLAALVYLVIINMNPSAQNKIPSKLDDAGV